MSKVFFLNKKFHLDENLSVLPISEILFIRKNELNRNHKYKCYQIGILE